MTDKTFGWCFIGAGGITHRVMQDMNDTKHCYLASVYNRTTSRAQELADLHGAKCYDDIKSAILDPNVKAVYIATTNDMHYEHCKIALECGKPVLCEKPFALNIKQTEEMLSLATAKNVYLMEAMWTRFNPAIKQMLAWIKGGVIGEVKQVYANFCFFSDNYESRCFAMDVGGGALLDIGVYTLAFSQFIFDSAPTTIQAIANISPTGSDYTSALQLKYPSGGIAQLISSFELNTDSTATVYGTKGRIVLPHFWYADKATLYVGDNDAEIFEVGKAGEGYNFEFDAVCEDILSGKKQNEFITHEYTKTKMRIMDEARRQIGVVYPSEAGK